MRAGDREIGGIRVIRRLASEQYDARSSATRAFDASRHRNDPPPHADDKIGVGRVHRIARRLVQRDKARTEKRIGQVIERVEFERLLDGSKPKLASEPAHLCRVTRPVVDEKPHRGLHEVVFKPALR